MKMKLRETLVGIAALPLHCAMAAIPIYLLPDDNLASTAWIRADDPNSWTTEFDDEAKRGTPGHPPTPSGLRDGSYNPFLYRAAFLDLGGQTLTINLLRNQATSPYTSSGYWGNVDHPWAFTNGTLRINYDMRTRHKAGGGVDVWNGADIDMRGLTFSPGSGLSGEGASTWTIHRGGRLATTRYEPYNATIVVEDGGMFEVKGDLVPEKGSTQPWNRIVNRGTVRFAKGLAYAEDGDAGFGLVVRQESGDLYVGGDIGNGRAMQSRFEFVFSGGTIRPTAMLSAIRPDANATVPDGSSVAVDVPPGGTLDLSGLVFGDGTTITLKGAGEVVFGESRPASLRRGDRIVYTGVPEEPIIGADGLQIVLRAPLLSLENLALPSEYEIILDPLALRPGMTVVKSPDAAFLESMQARLAADLPVQYPNADLSIVGDELRLVEKPVASATYYWNKGRRGDLLWGDATDLANWSIAWSAEEGMPDAAAVPVRWPTVNDELCVTRDLLLDLKGRTLCVKQMSLTPHPYGGTYWGRDNDSWGISNGTVFVDSDIITRHRGSADGTVTSSFDIYGGGRLVNADGTKPCAFTAGDGKGGDQPNGISYFRIHRGGEAVINSRFRFFSSRVIVDAGGRFEAKRVSFSNNTKYDVNLVENQGTCLFPLGIDTVEGTTNNNGRITFLQKGGLMRLGGDVCTNAIGGRIEFELSGGTLEAMSNVSFRVTAARVPEAASAKLKVAAGALLDMEGFAYGEGAALEKTGSGSVRFADYPASLTVSEGTLALTVDGVAVPPSVRFADGAGIRFAAADTELPAIANADRLACEVDLSVLKAGDTLATSPDVATLEGIRDGLNAAWVADERSRVRAKVEGTALMLVRAGRFALILR